MLYWEYRPHFKMPNNGLLIKLQLIKLLLIKLLLIMLLLCLMVLMINVEVRLHPHLPLRLHMPLYLVALRPDEWVALPLHLVAAEIEVEMMLPVARPSCRCCRRWRRRR